VIESKIKPQIRGKAEQQKMLRSKTTVFGMIAALILMTGAFTALSADELGGSATASDADVFVLVNGHEVLESDFITRVATVEQNVVMLQAQAESMPDQDNPTATVLEIMDSTPPETIALASLILDKVIFQEAIDRGHLPDREMVTQQVEQEREVFEMIEQDPEEYGVEQSAVDSYREQVEEIGEDRYWNEFYPQIIEQQAALQQFQMEVSQTGEDWIVIQRDVFNEANVQIGEPEQVAPATVEDARTYLNSVWDVYQAEDVS
jgi:hypothetical protein